MSAVDIDGATVDKPSLNLRQSAHTMCVCVFGNTVVTPVDSDYIRYGILDANRRLSIRTQADQRNDLDTCSHSTYSLTFADVKTKMTKMKNKDNNDKIKNKVGMGGVAHHRLHGKGRGWGGAGGLEIIL